MDWQKQNIKVYNDSAAEIAAYFSGIGSRVEDIERGFQLAEKTKGARAVEIGCGDGRDAAEIIKRAGWYEGIDPSEGFLEIARHKNQGASFVLADALSYSYPADIDIAFAFAFASLLHINRNDMRIALEKTYEALRPGGVFYISLKEKDEYAEEVKEDKYGKRMFYYYNISLIQEIAGDLFHTAFHERRQISDTKWFTIALKKNS